jgi:VWFA-related protein
MRRTLTVLAVGSLLSSMLAAQNPPPAQQQPPQQVDTRKLPPPPPEQAVPQGKNVIRSFTDLVQIDVQVLDKDGKPVKGLKKEQFHLAEDNKPQSITHFDYYDIERIETAGNGDDSQPVVVALGAIAEPEKVREAVRDRRMIVLFFDMTSLQPEDLLRATGAARKFLGKQMSPADLVGIVAFGNQLKVLANFTNDRDVLDRAVARLIPGKDSQLADLAASANDTVTEDTGSAFTADETEFNIFNTDRKLAALQGLADLLRDIPGRKSVIQFTGGITQTGEENRSQLRAATNAANRANVAFYTVDSRGLMAQIPGGDATTGAASGSSMFSGAAVYRQVQSRQDSRETLSTLASDTGGKSFFDAGDFGQVFKSIESDTAGYYLLGYYSTNTAQDGRWRSVKVRLDLPGAKIRFREGYYAPKTFGVYTAEDREHQLEEAMRSTTPRVELPVALETAHFRIGKNEVFVPIAAKIASSALQWAEKRGRREVQFDFVAEVREEGVTGRIVDTLRDTITVKLDPDRFQQVQQQAIVYQGGMILGPGNYRLKFLARENETGRVGTFEEDLLLPQPQADRLQLSSVLLSSQLLALQKNNEVERKALALDAKMKSSPLDVAGERIVPSVTRVFTTQQNLYVFFQAYSPTKAEGDKLRAGLVFFYNGQRVNATPLLEPADVDAKTQTASFRISLPLSTFVPGRYTVQAVVVEPGGAHAAFSRAYFALRLPPTAAPKPAATGSPSPN